MDPLDTETVDIIAHVTNQGDGPSTGPFSVRLAVDGMEAATVQASPIQPDDTATVTITAGPLEAGERLVEVAIDPDQEFEEWDEENNGGGGFLVVRQQQVIALDDSVVIASAASDDYLLFRLRSRSS